MKIAKLEQIGLSLGITKQAVSKLYVKTGLLIKNDSGQVDIEHSENRKFLKSKGANMDVFYPKKGASKKAPAKAKKKTTPKPKKTKAPPATPPIDTSPEPNFENTPENSNPESIIELETETRREKWKGLKKDNELKELKLQETKGRLFDGQLVQNIIFDILSVVASMVRTMADATVDEIISICETETDPDTKRNKVKAVILKYASTAMNKALNLAKKTFRKVKKGLET